jgi:hypothetical protein
MNLSDYNDVENEKKAKAGLDPKLYFKNGKPKKNNQNYLKYKNKSAAESNVKLKAVLDRKPNIEEEQIPDDSFYALNKHKKWQEDSKIGCNYANMPDPSPRQRLVMTVVQTNPEFIDSDSFWKIGINL